MTFFTEELGVQWNTIDLDPADYVEAEDDEQPLEWRLDSEDDYR